MNESQVEKKDRQIRATSCNGTKTLFPRDRKMHMAKKKSAEPLTAAVGNANRSIFVQI